MPMTPDEVVKEMQKRLSEAEKQRAEYGYPNKEVNKFIEIQKQAISLLQDYQKLRERIDVDELSFLIYKYETGLGEELARANWTAKHFQDKSKINSTPLAEQIVTYLQQPTEH